MRLTIASVCVPLSLYLNLLERILPLQRGIPVERLARYSARCNFARALARYKTESPSWPYRKCARVCGCVPYPDEATYLATGRVTRISTEKTRAARWRGSLYRIHRKPIWNYFSDKKLSVYGTLPGRPRHLEGREMPHAVLEDPDYPRASANVSTL